MDHLESVKRIVLAGLRNYPVRVFLFGSRARGNPRSMSDINVAVMPLQPLPVGALSIIREELEESLVPYTVDLVDLSEAAASLRESVEREGVLWTA